MWKQDGEFCTEWEAGLTFKDFLECKNEVSLETHEKCINPGLPLYCQNHSKTVV